MRDQVNARGEDGDSPLHIACLYGQAAVVEECIKRGADVNARDEDDSTPLHDAAAGGFDAIVAQLLLKGASTSAKDNEEDLMVVDTDELMGKPWTYELQISELKSLPQKVSSVQITYDFYAGTSISDESQVITSTFTTDKVTFEEGGKRNVKIDYTAIHHVDEFNQTFADWLESSELKFNVHVAP